MPIKIKLTNGVVTHSSDPTNAAATSFTEAFAAEVVSVANVKAENKANSDAADGLLKQLKTTRDTIAEFQEAHRATLAHYAELRTEEDSLVGRVKGLVKARGNGGKLKPFTVYEAHGQQVVAAPTRKLDLDALILAAPKVAEVGKIKKTMTLNDAEHLRASGVITAKQLAKCISCDSASVRITYATVTTGD